MHKFVHFPPSLIPGSRSLCRPAVDHLWAGREEYSLSILNLYTSQAIASLAASCFKQWSILCKRMLAGRASRSAARRPGGSVYTYLVALPSIMRQSTYYFHCICVASSNMAAFAKGAALLLLAATYLGIADGLVIDGTGTMVQPTFTNLTADSNVHCANDNSWLTHPVSDILVYEQSCQGAQHMARMELESHGLDTKFEFFDRNTRPKTTKPTIMLPRKYTVGKHHVLLGP